jgi:hypothetical protein
MKMGGLRYSFTHLPLQMRLGLGVSCEAHKIGIVVFAFTFVTVHGPLDSPGALDVEILPKGFCAYTIYLSAKEERISDKIRS